MKTKFQKIALCILFALLFDYSLATLECLSYLTHRSIDGSCNNLLFPSRGKRDTYFIHGPEGSQFYPQVRIPRITPLPTYADVHLLPEDDINGNARTISNVLASEYDENNLDVRNVTLFETFFAQFIGHDLENNKFINPLNASFEGDFVTYILDRNDILCTRLGEYRCNDNDTVLTTNGQRTEGIILENGTFIGKNNATAYLDLNIVYGDNEEVAMKLRTKSGGKLILNKERVFHIPMEDDDVIEYKLENFLPVYSELQVPLDKLFIMFGNTHLSAVAGDHRTNVNIPMAVLHTLFVREHNKVCDELMDRNLLWKLLPTIFDELIYQRARHIVIAKYQKIVYEQYLPSFLGANKYSQLGQYSGYNILTDTSTLVSFSTGASRYGHFTMKPFRALDECNVIYKYGKPSDDESYKPRNVGACNPTPESLTYVGRIVDYGSFENIIRGLISEVHLAMNFTMHPFLRNLDNVRGGFDLTSLDIMRSRFNNMPVYLKLRRTYNKLLSPAERNIYGNPDCPAYLEFDEDVDDPLECFLYITANVDKASKLKDLYNKVIYVDGLVGMMLENHDDTTSIGDTAGSIFIDQFKRLRDGDRFYYEYLINNNYFTSWEKSQIQETTMGLLLRRNFNGDEIDFPDNPFIMPPNYREALRDRCQS